MTGGSRRKAGKPQVSHKDVWIKLESSREFKEDVWLYQVQSKMAYQMWPKNLKAEFGGTRPAVVPDKSDPPKIAEFLLTMLLKPSYVASAIGDLREHLYRECRRVGRGRSALP